MKRTGVQVYGRQANPLLSISFYRGTGASRAPFFGVDISMAEKVKTVQAGVPDGRSGWPILRENGLT